MRRVVALLGCVGFLVAAVPAQAGQLTVSSDGTAYHFTYTTGKHRAARIHVGGDVTWTAFMDTSRTLRFTDATGQCIRTSLYRVQCPFEVTTVTAHLSLGADVYAASGVPWLSSTVYGRRGADTIYGGMGDDTLYGGRGDDHLDGRDGTNQLFGGLGNDTCLHGTPTTCEIT